MVQVLRLNNLAKLLYKVCSYSFIFALAVMPFAKAGLEIFLIISIVSWLAYKLAVREPLSTNRKVLLLCGSFIIISSVSAFYSGYPELSFRGMIKLIKNILIFLIAADLFRNKRLHKPLAFSIFISFVLVGVDSAAQYLLGKDPIVGRTIQYTDLQIRITGPFAFYGLLGAFLIAYLPAFFGAIFYVKKNLSKFFLAMISSSGIALLYKTHSRGAWLAAFFSWFVFALIIKNKRLLAVLFIFLMIAPFFLPYNAIIHLDSERKEQSLAERFYLWDRALQVILAEPLFGCGINTYVKNYPKYDKTNNWRVPGYYAHNGYLQLAAETGLIALFTFLWVVGESFKQGYQAFKKMKPKSHLIAGLMAGLAALMLQALIDTTLHNLQSAALIWFFMGLLVGVGQTAESYE